MQRQWALLLVLLEAACFLAYYGPYSNYNEYYDGRHPRPRLQTIALKSLMEAASEEDANGTGLLPCPSVPPGLVGKVEVNNTSVPPPWKDLSAMHKV